jgi:ribonuclease T1
MISRLMRTGLLLCSMLVCIPVFGAGPLEQDDLPAITAAELPAEARDTLRVIKQGGPFPYDRDGAVFMNYERALPGQTRGYYREYTVKTPGVRDRGTRRMVCGPLPECYYTSDHYLSFKRIRE